MLLLSPLGINFFEGKKRKKSLLVCHTTPSIRSNTYTVLKYSMQNSPLCYVLSTTQPHNWTQQACFNTLLACHKHYLLFWETKLGLNLHIQSRESFPFLFCERKNLSNSAGPAIRKVGEANVLDYLYYLC